MCALLLSFRAREKEPMRPNKFYDLPLSEGFHCLARQGELGDALRVMSSSIRLLD